MRTLYRLLASSLLCLAAAGANAAIVTYTSRATFATDFTGSVYETWDGFDNGTVLTNGSVFNGITYNSSTGDAMVTAAFLPSTTPNSLGRTSQGFFDGGDTITFTFNAPVQAFGIDVNTFSATAGAYTATTNLGDVAASAFDPFPAATSGQFIGFSSDTAFTSVTIASSIDFGFTLDTLRLVPAEPGNGVPEPGALALTALALLALGAGSSRRRRVHPEA